MSYFWKPYVPVAQRRAQARAEMEKLRKKGVPIQPVDLTGRNIATSFWGNGWCEHLESFSDFESRLPRGRSYVRNGSVCHLDVQPGNINAFVSGSELYKVHVKIAPLQEKVWKKIKGNCRGRIGSVLELLQGKLSDHVMTIVSDRDNGLFPKPGEMTFQCSCPDWASMCKHVAAVLYGVGSRLDHRPELLFLLRAVDADELIDADMTLPLDTARTSDTLGGAGLADIFGIDLETEDVAAPQPTTKARKSGKTKTAATSVKPSKCAVPPAPPKPTKKAASPSARPATTKRPPGSLNPKTPTGAAIARLRKRSGLSVGAFARAVGVSESAVRRWEATSGAIGIQRRFLMAMIRFQDNLPPGSPG